MTINIAISTYEGVVLGCDSLSSRTALAVMPFSNGDSFAKDAAGNDIIDAQGNKVFSVSELRHVVTDVFTGAQKMFLIFEDDECSVAGVTAGMATMNGLTIAGHAGNFRRETSASDMRFASVQEAVRSFADHMREEWEASVSFSTAGAEQRQHFPDLQFIIGGYSSEEQGSPLYKVSIKDNTRVKQFEDGSGTGACWAGQADFVERLLMGIDSRLQRAIFKKVGNDLATQAQQIAESVVDQLNAAGIAVPGTFPISLPQIGVDLPIYDYVTTVDFANLPTQYAVELVELLVNLQSGMQRFETGIATVGGRTHVGVIKRGEKFAMLNEPSLVHSHVGYSHDH
ncbi:MAG: hypothetical protein ACKVK5_17060 [Pseudomonadales bacterium]